MVMAETDPFPFSEDVRLTTLDTQHSPYVAVTTTLPVDVPEQPNSEADFGGNEAALIDASTTEATGPVRGLIASFKSRFLGVKIVGAFSILIVISGIWDVVAYPICIESLAWRGQGDCNTIVQWLALYPRSVAGVPGIFCYWFLGGLTWSLLLCNLAMFLANGIAFAILRGAKELVLVSILAAPLAGFTFWVLGNETTMYLGAGPLAVAWSGHLLAMLYFDRISLKNIIGAVVGLVAAIGLLTAVIIINQGCGCALGNYVVDISFPWQYFPTLLIGALTAFVYSKFLKIRFVRLDTWESTPKAEGLIEMKVAV